jgi:hypothetical protein
MTASRVLIMALTVVAATGAGYGLLGLKAPRHAPQAPALASRQVATRTIYAIGPDGRLYAIEVPYANGASGQAYRRGGFSDGYGRRGTEEGGSYFEGNGDE